MQLTKDTPTKFLEKSFTLPETLDLRRLIPIEDQGESLKDVIQSGFLPMQIPHPYMAARAPYGEASPFYLRAGVVERLTRAQSLLDAKLPGATLRIYDGYRPAAVQLYMRTVCYEEEAKKLGFWDKDLTQEQDSQVWKMVDCLWARPSTDPNLPTPHSTGAAVDLTIFDRRGNELAMGSKLDDTSPQILPSHFDGQSGYAAAEFSYNRELLRSVMEAVGFHRLSHEWWHFSYGDQYWAMIEFFKTGVKTSATYGQI